MWLTCLHTCCIIAHPKGRTFISIWSSSSGLQSDVSPILSPLILSHPFVLILKEKSGFSASKCSTMFRNQALTLSGCCLALNRWSTVSLSELLWLETRTETVKMWAVTTKTAKTCSKALESCRELRSYDEMYCLFRIGTNLNFACIPLLSRCE